MNDLARSQYSSQYASAALFKRRCSYQNHSGAIPYPYSAPAPFDHGCDGALGLRAAARQVQPHRHHFCGSCLSRARSAARVLPHSKNRVPAQLAPKRSAGDVGSRGRRFAYFLAGESRSPAGANSRPRTTKPQHKQRAEEGSLKTIATPALAASPRVKFHHQPRPASHGQDHTTKARTRPTTCPWQVCWRAGRWTAAAP